MEVKCKKESADMVYIICTHLCTHLRLEVRNAELYDYWFANARQKNSTPFRFRGLRKRRENCISVESFFLLQIGPASLGSDLGKASLV